MGKAAVVRAFEEIRAALAVLQAEVDGAGLEAFADIDAVSDPLAGLADGCLEILAGAREVEARVAGVKAKAAVGYAEAAHAVAGPEVPVVAQEMAVTAEIGCVLALGPRAAASFLATSHALTSSLPRTLEALQAGVISWQHAIVLADETAGLDAAGAAALEAHFLDPEAQDAARGCPAGELPAHRFRVKARTWRERHHAESIEKRHARGLAERRVEFRPDRDGMAWLGAYLPADQAQAGWNRLTAAARGLQGPGEDRTMPQLRADSFAAAILGSTSGSGTSAASGTGHQPPSVRAEVLVTVPVFALMGLTDEPAMLDGYGPVPASMARRLVADGAGSFYRVLVDPRDGAPLEIGRKSYRVPRAMRVWLRMRDGKCPFPGCSNTSLDTEADHLLAWHHGGTTGISNLGQPCPKHHRLRHTTAWKPTPASTNEPPSWTSPTGRHYTSEHQDWEPPRWPERPQPGSIDIVHHGTSPWEDALEKFLHAHA